MDHWIFAVLGRVWFRGAANWRGRTISRHVISLNRSERRRQGAKWTMKTLVRWMVSVR